MTYLRYLIAYQRKCQSDRRFVIFKYATQVVVIITAIVVFTLIYK